MDDFMPYSLDISLLKWSEAGVGGQPEIFRSRNWEKVVETFQTVRQWEKRSTAWKHLEIEDITRSPQHRISRLCPEDRSPERIAQVRTGPLEVRDKVWDSHVATLAVLWHKDTAQGTKTPKECRPYDIKKVTKAGHEKAGLATWESQTSSRTMSRPEQSSTGLLSLLSNLERSMIRSLTVTSAQSPQYGLESWLRRLKPSNTTTV